MSGFQGITISQGQFARPITSASRGPIDSNFVTPNADDPAARAQFLAKPQATAIKASPQAEPGGRGLMQALERASDPDQRRLIEAQIKQALEDASTQTGASSQVGQLADLRA